MSLLQQKPAITGSKSIVTQSNPLIFIEVIDIWSKPLIWSKAIDIWSKAVNIWPKAID